MDRNDRAFIAFAVVLCGWFALAAYTVHSTLANVPRWPFAWCDETNCWTIVEDDVATIGLLFVGLIVGLVVLSRFASQLAAALAAPVRIAWTVIACTWLYAIAYCSIVAGIRLGYAIDWPTEAGAVDRFRSVGRTHMVIALALLAAAAPVAVVATVRGYRRRQ